MICPGNIANYCFFLYFILLQSDIINTLECDDLNDTSDDTEAGCELLELRALHSFSSLEGAGAPPQYWQLQNKNLCIG